MDLLESQESKKNIEKIKDKIESEMKKRKLKHLITIESEIFQEVIKEENLKKK